MAASPSRRQRGPKPGQYCRNGDERQNQELFVRTAGPIITKDGGRGMPWDNSYIGTLFDQVTDF